MGRMRRVKYWGALAVLMALSASTALAAENFKKIDEKEAAALAVYAPRPNYPYEARAKREMGSGVVIVTPQSRIRRR